MIHACLGRAGPRRAARTVGMVLCLSLGACATAFPTRNPFEGGGQDNFRLDVVNQNFYDATLFVVGDMASPVRRVGNVVGNGRGTFQVPWTGTAAMFVEIRLLSNGACRTESVLVNPGDVLDLRILPNFPNGFCR